ncbi:phospholipase, partial [Microbacterium sp. zg.Y909]|nr:phospholipase [Microbacterium sp. zg.Y909]
MHPDHVVPSSRRALRAQSTRRHRGRVTATLAVGAGVLLGGFLTSGAAAVAAELPFASDTAVAPALQEVADDAQATVDAAHAALAAGEALTAEVAQSGLDVGGDAEVDTVDLQDTLEELAGAEGVELLREIDVVVDVEAHTDDVEAETADLRARFDLALQQKAEAEAAAAA